MDDRMSSPKKSCFFIAPIGAEGSAERNQSDWVLKYLVRPALGSNYEVVRSDQIAEPGSISHQIIQQIAKCDLAVVDLTGLNPNVIYELSVRHTLNRPAVQMMDASQKLPFDLYGERTIFFKYGDVASMERAQSDLRRFVRETERKNFKSTSPVSRSIDIANLHEQSTGVSDAIASVLEEIISIKDKVGEIDSRTWSIETTIEGVESNIDEVKSDIEHLAPSTLRSGGLYIDDSRLIRMFEEIELLLKRIERRKADRGA
jgi:hypothetical protein